MKMFSISRQTSLVLVLFVQAAALPSTAKAAAQGGLLKPKEVKALISNAATPADHLKLARHFAAKAEMHEKEAVEHDMLAADYAEHTWKSSGKIPMAPNTVAHCKYYAEHCRRAAAEMRALAREHQAMAEGARD